MKVLLIIFLFHVCACTTSYTKNNTDICKKISTDEANAKAAFDKVKANENIVLYKTTFKTNVKNPQSGLVYL